MATINLHCEDCEALLGDPCLEVHEFLDQYAAFFPVQRFFEYHRTFLHNRYGLDIAGAKWGERGRKAAMIHIVRDYMEAPIPRDLEWVERTLNRALKSFNELYRFEPHIDPRVVKAWNGKGLCAIAFEEEMDACLSSDLRYLERRKTY